MSALTMERAGDTADNGDNGAAGPVPPSMVERMTLILDLFTTREAHLSLEVISRSTGLPRSTAHRILDQLVRLHWLEHSTHGYRIGPRAIVLGGRAGDHGELRSAASPYLHELLMQTGAVIHLAVLDGAQVRYLDKLGGRSATAVPSRVGGAAPAHCTALGKAMLAWLEPETVDELVAGDLSARTPATISRADALHGELGRIRARGGLALERGECFPDIACAASAIRGPRGPIGAVSIVTGADTALERVAPLVVDAARRIAADLYPDRVRAVSRHFESAPVGA